MKKTMKKIIAFVLTVTTMSICSVFADTTAQPETGETAATQNSTAYTGEAVTPDIALQDAGVTLVNGTDYDLEYQNNIEVGTATIIVKFKGNYEGERSVNFEIVARTLSNQDVSFASIDTQMYTGEAITPEPEIMYNGVTLEKDKDYTLSYADNVNVGTASINVTFMGNYTGTAATTFAIKAKAVTEANITISTIADQVYTGKEIKPEPTVTDVTR